MMSNKPKLPPTKTHFVKVKNGARLAKTGEGMGKRLITIDAKMFSKKSKNIPNTGARFKIRK